MARTPEDRAMALGLQMLLTERGQNEHAEECTRPPPSRVAFDPPSPGSEHICMSQGWSEDEPAGDHHHHDPARGTDTNGLLMEAVPNNQTGSSVFPFMFPFTLLPGNPVEVAMPAFGGSASSNEGTKEKHKEPLGVTPIGAALANAPDRVSADGRQPGASNQKNAGFRGLAPPPPRLSSPASGGGSAEPASGGSDKKAGKAASAKTSTSDAKPRRIEKQALLFPSGFVLPMPDQIALRPVGCARCRWLEGCAPSCWKDEPSFEDGLGGEHHCSKYRTMPCLAFEANVVANVLHTRIW